MSRYGASKDSLRANRLSGSPKTRGLTKQDHPSKGHPDFTPASKRQRRIQKRRGLV